MPELYLSLFKLEQAFDNLQIYIDVAFQSLVESIVCSFIYFTFLMEL